MAKERDLDYAPDMFLPDSTSGWSRLQTPDTGGVKKNGKPFSKRPTYDIQVMIEDTPEWAAVIQQLTDFENERRAANGHDPLDVTTAIQTDKDGNRMLVPRSLQSEGEPRRFVLRDANNRDIDSEVWKGSKVRVHITPKFSDSTFKTCLVLYLNGVMVLETPERQSGGGSGPVKDPFARATPAAPAAAPQRPVQQPTADPFAKVK